MEIIERNQLEEYKELGTISEFKELKEKMEKIQKIMNKYEKTFEWSCNDSVHSAIAHAVYGVVEDKDYFLEEYNEFLDDF